MQEGCNDAVSAFHTCKASFKSSALLTSTHSYNLHCVLLRGIEVIYYRLGLTLSNSKLIPLSVYDQTETIDRRLISMHYYAISLTLTKLSKLISQSDCLFESQCQAIGVEAICLQDNSVIKILLALGSLTRIEMQLSA